MTATAEAISIAATPVLKPKGFHRPLPNIQFKEAAQIRNVWSVTPVEGTDFADVTEKTEYWAHVARLLRRGDRIEVYPEDNTYFAELIVRDRGDVWARVDVLRKHDYKTETIEADVPDDHSVEWKGPHHKFAVIRRSDKEKIRSGFDSREDAVKWLVDHKRALTR